MQELRKEYMKQDDIAIFDQAIVVPASKIQPVVAGMTNILDILDMHKIMQEDGDLLEAAFEKFKESEITLKMWREKFHAQASLNDRGMGQWIAARTMQEAMPKAVRKHGLANVDKMHQNFEGWLAWAHTCGNLEIQWAADNLMDYMDRYHALVESLPYDHGWAAPPINPNCVRDHWDLRRMLELKITLLDES